MVLVDTEAGTKAWRLVMRGTTIETLRYTRYEVRLPNNYLSTECSSVSSYARYKTRTHVPVPQMMYLW